MEYFGPDVRARDGERCIVCGSNNWPCTYIIPRCDDLAWKELKQRQLIPEAAQDAEAEVRNGIVLCVVHRKEWDSHSSYIRWSDELQKFIFVYHAQVHRMFAEFHGCVVHLDPADPFAPFPAAFLMHEMCVRGRHPFQEDTPIKITDNLLYQYQEGITGRHLPLRTAQGIYIEAPTGNTVSSTTSVPALSLLSDGVASGSDIVRPGCLISPKERTITFTNPFFPPGEVDALKRSWVEQPSWKAAESGWTNRTPRDEE